MSNLVLREGIVPPPKGTKRILILGGGIAGLRVAVKLEKELRSMVGWELMLLDENEYHQYLYTIHEVAGGRTPPSRVVVPFEYLLRNKKIEFARAWVQDIDPASRLVHTDLGPVSYDILVVALGGHTEFYGIEGLRENSFTLQSVKDAIRLKLEIENLFADSHISSESAIVVGGGGAVGVELVAELFELVQTLRKKHGVKEPIEVILIEATERLIPNFNSKASEKIAQKLRSLGVRVMLGDPIVKAEKGYLHLKSGTRIPFSLLVWTGGALRDPSCGAFLEVKNRRLCMDAYSQAEGLRKVYVVGDCALVTDPTTGKALPPSAHVAMEQADIVVKNVLSDITGSPKAEYTPTQVGEVVSIGSRDTVGVLYGIHVSGFVGKAIKNLIHLGYLGIIGGLRLILRRKKVGHVAATRLLDELERESKEEQKIQAHMVSVAQRSDNPFE